MINAAVEDLIALNREVRVKVAINAYEALPAGRTVLGQVWSGDMLNAVISYLPRNLGPEVLSYTYQREGGPVFNDCIAVAAAATKPVLAHRFMDFMLEPRNAIENFTGYVGYQPPLNDLTADSLIADEIIPPNLASTIVTREAYANGNAFLTLTAAGIRRWDRGWARFQAG